MIKVKGIDHLSISVRDYKKSKSFYGRLFKFMGFKILDEYDDAMGWTNGKTRFWISPVDAKYKKHQYHEGELGFGHYAFELKSRKDVNALQQFLGKMGAKIVDPAAEYYKNYYAVYFTDPDGFHFEGMRYGKS